MVIKNFLGRSISTIAFVAVSSSVMANESELNLDMEYDEYGYEFSLEQDETEATLEMLFNEDGLRQIELDDQVWEVGVGFHL